MRWQQTIQRSQSRVRRVTDRRAPPSSTTASHGLLELERDPPRALTTAMPLLEPQFSPGCLPSMTPPHPLVSGDGNGESGTSWPGLSRRRFCPPSGLRRAQRLRDDWPEENGNIVPNAKPRPRRTMNHFFGPLVRSRSHVPCFPDPILGQQTIAHTSTSPALKAPAAADLSHSVRDPLVLQQGSYCAVQPTMRVSNPN